MWENQTGEEEQCHQAVVNKANHCNPFKRKTQDAHNTKQQQVICEPQAIQLL